MRAATLAVGFVLFATCLSFAAEDPNQIGARIYREAADAVFVVAVKNGDQTVGIGSAFLIGPGQLLTNAHVVAAGTPYIRAGVAELRCAVKRVDAAADLALLEVDVALTAKPLRLAASDPQNGSIVFALGSPRGLERTITQGLLTGERSFGGSSRYQISAPISPGSSGGPILDITGDVIGVAVSGLTDAQNINFAIPLAAVRAFLAAPSKTLSVDDALARIERLETEQKNLDYSDDDTSPWQQRQHEIVDTLRTAADQCAPSDSEGLSRLAEAAGRNDVDLAVLISKRAIAAEVKPAVSPRRTLADALHLKSLLASDKQSEATLLTDAEVAATQVVGILGNKSTSADYERLSSIKLALGKPRDALRFAEEAVRSCTAADCKPAALAYARALRDTGDAKKATAAFRALAGAVQLSTYEWREYGDLLSKTQEYAESASAYDKARDLANDRESKREALCAAGKNYWAAGQFDTALERLRVCVAESLVSKHGDADAAVAHRLMASMLVSRGVYDGALNEAREALSIDPQDAWASHDMSQALMALGRNEEAITAARTAVRLSDGKYATMHLQLGLALYRQQHWPEALASFRTAADIDTADTYAPYDAALACVALGYTADAKRWLNTALQRNANAPNRADIVTLLQSLQQ